MVFRKKNQYSIFSIYSGRMKATPTLVLGRPECFADEGRLINNIFFRNKLRCIHSQGKNLAFLKS